MFNTTEGPTAVVKPLLGYTYYTPKRKDLRSCMSDILSFSNENSLPDSVIGVRCPTTEPCPAPELRMVESRARIAIYRLFSSRAAVANQCSGAAVDRRANVVMVGSLRDTASTANPEECIEKCVMAEKELGFQCLSVMYYYDETVLNCILNDASAKTNPESMAEEDRAIVDYFGVDDCYGMPEVEDTRQV
ncbi:PAN domain protein [Ancylostoma caninum]|uniref:PAN domain protein n=1 Tax=Ancylostoma caninum TaxID=29170 RepID=A0A368GX96_ANCCA|nr:PAN domain protein [Ancylostoma caninum]